jgi:gluconolactonase
VTVAPALERLIGASPRLESIASGVAPADGPVFSRLQYLFFSDVSGGRILKWQDGKVGVYREKSRGALGLTFDHQGRLLACEAGRVTRTEKDGQITVLAAAGLERPRDLVYAIDGSIYFTDRGVHQITRRGEVRLVSRDCQRPRGVALAPDQQKLYVADEGRHDVLVYDVAPDGALRNRRRFAETGSDAPAGLKTDEEGNVWLAAGPRILVLDARGQRLGEVPVPEPASNCTWGDGFTALYITTRSSVHRLATKTHGTRTY